MVTTDTSKPVPVIVSVSKSKLSLKLLFQLYIVKFNLENITKLLFITCV